MIPVLYQSETVVVVDKPAGMLVHRTRRDKDETTFLMQTVRNQLGRHVYTVHRLDKPTSGALVLALDPDTARELSNAFVDKRVKKEYVALTRGWVHDPVVIDYPLSRESGSGDDQDAVTHVEPVRRLEVPFPVGRYRTARYTFLKLMPETGRTHQLRRHMKHIFHPILGDRKYGDRDHYIFLKQKIRKVGLMLHASTITLPDGTVVDAPLPERMVRTLEWLDSHG